SCPTRTDRRAQPSPAPPRALARGRRREAGAKDRCEAKPSVELQGDEEKCANGDEERADRKSRVEVLFELRVDRERQRLRHSLQAAGEDDRRAELAEPAGKCQRRGGAEPSGCERQRNAQKYASRSRTESPGRVDECPVDRLERRDRPPEVERALDEGDCQDDSCLGERDLDAEGMQLAAEEAGAAER